MLPGMAMMVRPALGPLVTMTAGTDGVYTGYSPGYFGSMSAPFDDFLPGYAAVSLQDYYDADGYLLVSGGNGDGVVPSDVSRWNAILIDGTRRNLTWVENGAYFEARPVGLTHFGFVDGVSYTIQLSV